MTVDETYHLVGVNRSAAQLTLSKSALGEPLADAELVIFRECTGRADYPFGLVPEEVDILCGRKSGKTEYIASVLLIHRAVTDTDAPGVYLLVCPSKSDQARIAWQAIVSQLQRGFPGLIAEIKESEYKIYLHNGNIIAIASANFRNLRGPKYKVVVIDEGCFYVSETPEDGGANPLGFILDSVVGGMVATEHPLLLLLSTPWNKNGVMWEHFRDRDSNPNRLVWRAPTLLMNPHANVNLMERHRRERGENFYRREYLSEFSEDSFAFIEAADVDAAITPFVPLFPPKDGVQYHMGLDPGRKRDHFGAAIAHKEFDRVIVDWCREWKPGLLGLRYSDVLPEIWQHARDYGIRKIFSDQVDFGGLEASIPQANGSPEFELERVMTGGQAGAELADTTRGLFASRRLTLPDQSGLADEFKRLADYLTQGGARDIRAKRGHDDRSRACMLAIHRAFSQPQAAQPICCFLSFADSGDGAQRSEEDLRSEERQRYFFAPGKGHQNR